MKYAVVYSSKTGNTERLAETIKEVLPKEELLYYGEPKEEAMAADRIYVGFWTDKGTCDEPIRSFLESLQNKEVFLFGTAGFGGDQEYFNRILGGVSKCLPGTVTLVGSYMCQGRMPQAVKQRYEKLLETKGPDVKITGLLANFERALAHPDEKDLEQLRKIVGEGSH